MAKGQAGNWGPSHYLVAYTRPESPEGSCHKIELRVNRGSALIAARNQYCNTKHSTSDPVNGTTLGDQLQSDLTSPKNNNVHISLAATPLYSSSDSDRVHIAIDWPWESLKGNTRTKGVLALFSKKDGTLVARFSDLAEWEGVANSNFPEIFYSNSDKRSDWAVENRYETQLTLPPGEYDLRIALGDGTRFGNAAAALTVENYDRPNSLSAEYPSASEYRTWRQIPRSTNQTYQELGAKNYPAITNRW
jgi:hypothetical protein